MVQRIIYPTPDGGGVNDANTTSKTTIITKFSNGSDKKDCDVVAVTVTC